MRSKALALLALSALCCATAFAQGEGQGQGQARAGGQNRGRQTAPPPTDKVTPEIKGVVTAGTKIEVVKFGLQGADGAVGMPDGSILVSTNGGVAKIDVDGNLTQLVENNQAAGLALDPKGRIIAAQYAGKVAVVYPPEEAKVLADSYEGKPFIRPNDLVIDKKGGIYFTDCYQAGAKPKPGDLPQAVYYITPAGKVTQVATDISRPNGITLSPDEKTLYVNDWNGSYLVTYDVQPDGALKNRKNFGKFDTAQDSEDGGPKVSGADGLCIDSEKHTYSTTPAGLQVFSAKGEHLANVDIPLDLPSQNCGFAGPDKHYLYVVGRGVVFRIHTIPAGYTGRGK
jgi:gluconolactonase